MSTFFETPDLWFRGADPKDAKAVAGWFNDPAVRRYLDHRVFPMSEQAEVKFLERFTTLDRNRSDVILLFGDKGSPDPIGATGFHAINWIARCAVFGVSIGAAHQGQGFGQQVTMRMIQYGFEELNLERIELEVVATHAPAIHVYEKCGFEREGVRRRAMWVHGKYEDALLMAILRS